MHVLLIGKNREMLEKLMANVEDRGLSIDGTTEMHTASEQFDAADFDLVAFGGGIDPPLRARLKRDFNAQNPDVVLMDVFAPVAVEQIVQASRDELDPQKLASQFEVVREAENYAVRLEIRREADVRVQVYHLGDTLDVTASIERHVAVGSAEIRIDHGQVRPGVNMILVTLDDREFHFERIEHPGPSAH